MKNIHILLYFISFVLYSQKNILHVKYQFQLALGNSNTYHSSLYIANDKSLFLWNKPIANDNINDDETIIRLNLNAKDSIGSFNYTQKDSLLSRMVSFNKQTILLKEYIPKINWEIQNDIQKIGGYICQKAIGVFRGREYIAWFTADIPTSYGPWKLHGLPGLILKAYDSTKELKFDVKSISKTKEFIVPNVNVDQQINIQEYKALLRQGQTQFVKKIRSKLPRGTTLTVNKKNQMEFFVNE